MWIFWWLFGSIIRRLKGKRQRKSFEMRCPHCDFEGCWGEPPWFVCKEGGSSYIPGEPTLHWFRGVQTCPRCRWKFDYEDSE